MQRKLLRSWVSSHFADLSANNYTRPRRLVRGEEGWSGVEAGSILKAEGSMYLLYLLHITDSPSYAITVAITAILICHMDCS
jgi:hypothetical protein